MVATIHTVQLPHMHIIISYNTHARAQVEHTHACQLDGQADIVICLPHFLTGLIRCYDVSDIKA